MDARENLLRTVRFEKPDHIPMTFHINGACWEHYPHEALQDLMEAHPFLFPRFRRTSSPAPIEYPPFARAGEPFTDPWGCVWETPQNGLMGIVTKHPLERWDAFDDYRPPDPNQTTHWGPIDWRHEAENLGPAISQTSLSNGEIGHGHTWLKLIDIRGYENALIDLQDREPRVFRLLEMLEAFNRGLVQNYLEYGRAEWMGFAEDLGMQRGPMLSPRQFREFIQPSYRRLMAIARDAGCIIHVHADGDLRMLWADLLDCGVDVINLQDLVNGVDWIASHLTGRVCVDLDVDRQSITVGGSPAQIDALICEEVEKLGGQRGGLMMIYGLYPGVPLENAKAVMDAMEKYAGLLRLIRRPADAAEADMVASEAGVLDSGVHAGAAARTASFGVAVPGPAAEDVLLPLAGPSRVLRWAGLVVGWVVDIVAPLGHVPLHVEQPPGVRLLGAHRMGLPGRVGLKPAGAAEFTGIAADLGTDGAAGSASVLPFRFGRQPISVGREVALRRLFVVARR